MAQVAPLSRCASRALVTSLCRPAPLTMVHRPVALFVRFNASPAHSGSTFPQKDIAKESMNPRKPVENLIINDHRSFDELFERYHTIKGNAALDVENKQAIVNEFIREVAQHSIAEETCVYNLIDKHISEDIGDHLRKDHAEVKDNLYQLNQMRVGDNGFDQLFEKIVTLLKTHAKEEEEIQLPALRSKIPNVNDRVNISAQFLRAKVIAPTRPHPSAPDKPAILEMLAGLPIAPLDKLQDQMRNFAERLIPQE